MMSSSPDPFAALTDSDRNMLSESIQELLAHGSILGLEKNQNVLYHWCRQNFELLRQTAQLMGLDISILHEERMVQAMPRQSHLQLHLNKDATIIWLALWYVADLCWRDEGLTSAQITVAELNGVLKDTLLPDLQGLPSQTRLREILRQASRYNLIQFHPADPFEDSGIEVQPAIRRIVPFHSLAEWTETAARFQRDNDSDALIPSTPAESDLEIVDAEETPLSLPETQAEPS